MKNTKNTGSSGTGQDSENIANELKKRKHKKYTVSIDLAALSKLEGTTTSSFIDLARVVILIDEAPYNEHTLPMSKSRKIDFERLISHYAQLEIYGARKYHVKSVFKRTQKDIPNDVTLPIKKKAPYTKRKPLTDAQKEARKMVYQAKKAKDKKAGELAAAEEIRKATEKISKMNEGQDNKSSNT